MNFLCKRVSTYNDLLQITSTFIEKEETVLRNSTPNSQRLSAMLCFLATGQAFKDLKFKTAIALQTLSRTVLETCEAIIWALN